jgi:hypothetical protein
MITIDPLNIDGPACVAILEGVRPERVETYTRTLIHHPFLKPPLNPSNRRRGKKKQSKEESGICGMVAEQRSGTSMSGWDLHKDEKFRGTMSR